MSRNEPVELYVEEVLAETELALLCDCEGADEDGVWLPRSQLLESEVDTVGDFGYVEIPRWLAEEKELV